jgi:hypothetical protein
VARRSGRQYARQAWQRRKNTHVQRPRSNSLEYLRWQASGEPGYFRRPGSRPPMGGGQDQDSSNDEERT